MREVRICWPVVPSLTDREVTILRSIDYEQRHWHTSLSSHPGRLTDRLIKRGLIMGWSEKQARGLHGGWHLTTLGEDVLRRLDVAS